eukprot:197239-Chlamydomonas_euryale.AAC.1
MEVVGGCAHAHVRPLGFRAGARIGGAVVWRGVCRSAASSAHESADVICKGGCTTSSGHACTDVGEWRRVVEPCSASALRASPPAVCVHACMATAMHVRVRLRMHAHYPHMPACKRTWWFLHDCRQHAPPHAGN